MNFNIKKFGFLWMPLIIIVFLTINLLGVVFDFTICESDGCEASKSLLKINQSILYILALIGFVFLTIVGNYNIKTNFSLKPMIRMFNYFLGLILICETVLITYLIVKTGEICTICSIFYSLIWVNFIITSHFNSIDEKELKEQTINFKFILLCVGLIVLILHMILDIKSDKDIKTIQNKYTLLQSESCSHCKATKEYLKNKNIEYSKERFEDYIGLFNTLNIKTIPVMVVKEDDKIVILNGENQVKNYFDNIVKEKTVNTFNSKINNSLNFNNFSSEQSFQLNNLTQSSEIKNDISSILPKQDEGCSIEVLKNEENCEEPVKK